MNTTQATRVPVGMNLAGTSYPVRILTYRELAEISAWLDANLPSPLDKAIRAVERARATGTPMDDRHEEAFLDRASERMASWPPRPGTDDWFAAIDSTASGMVEMVRVILSKTVSGFDTRRAEELFDAMTGQELLTLALMGVRGERPKGDPAPPTPDRVPYVQEEAHRDENLAAAVATAAEWGPWRQ